MDLTLPLSRRGRLTVAWTRRGGLRAVAWTARAWRDLAPGESA